MQLIFPAFWRFREYTCHHEYHWDFDGEDRVEGRVLDLQAESAPLSAPPKNAV
jgi:hypothetical protein